VSGDLRDRFERAPLPDAEDARRRAWEVVSAAAPRPPARSRARRWRVPVAVLLAAAGTAIALSPPGAAVGDWVRARVAAPKQAPEPVTRPATRLPTAGRLLVRDARGIAVVGHDGSRTALGRYDGATWSPRGLFVAVWRGTRLSALTPGGAERWRVTAPEPIRAARWSLEPGFRVAYLTTGGELRVVAGDGTGDRPFARAGAAIPAWRPGGGHVLAYVSPSGRVEVRDVDTGALIASPRVAVPRARALSWSPSGRRLAVTSAREIRVFDLRGRRSRTIARASQPRARFTAAVFSPTDATLAVVTRSHGRSTVTAGRELFATRGRIAGATWSHDGRWLMLDAPDARQLIAVRVRGAPRVLSYPGGRVQGWSP
jgi:hypothetical protein